MVPDRLDAIEDDFLVELDYELIVEKWFDEDLTPPSTAFPTQFFGFRTFYNAAVREFSLVAEADAPTGMGGVLKIDKNGTKYAVYLVETTDPNASNVRIQTTTGIKALRLKT